MVYLDIALTREVCFTGQEMLLPLQETCSIIGGGMSVRRDVHFSYHIVSKFVITKSKVNGRQVILVFFALPLRKMKHTIRVKHSVSIAIKKILCRPLLFILSAAILRVCPADPNYFQNHSMISISGWPQSGTSLVYEYLLRTPGVSTMIDNCERFFPQVKCIAFNFEVRNKLPVITHHSNSSKGQWILPGKRLQAYDSCLS